MALLILNRIEQTASCAISIHSSFLTFTTGTRSSQHTKRERWDGEKVRRRNSLAMVSEERQPLLDGNWISRSSPDPSRDTPFREIETQLEQFAVNARRSPGRNLGKHSKDQGANPFADTLPPSYSSES
jgi:hypothetical protein